MAERITGIYLAEDGVANTVFVEDELETYYKMLDCDCIDIVTRKVGNKWYGFVCDDEGLLKDRAYTIISKQDGQYWREIVGSVFICNNDGEGNLTSLDQTDVINLMEHLHPIIDDCKIRHLIEINWKGVM